MADLAALRAVVLDELAYLVARREADTLRISRLVKADEHLRAAMRAESRAGAARPTVPAAP